MSTSSPEHTTPPAASEKRVPLDAITLDDELQPRAKLDAGTLANYVELLTDGVKFPPVTVFRDSDEILWLADGFHRWQAHKQLNLDAIDIEQIEGSRRDALLYSLSANSKHGLQRSHTDSRRAYEIACRNKLVDAADTDAVVALLRCSGRWAQALTSLARDAAKNKRNRDVNRLRDEGKTVREIASEIGMSRSAVDRVPKTHTSEMGQVVQDIEEIEDIAVDPQDDPPDSAKPWDDRTPHEKSPEDIEHELEEARLVGLVDQVANAIGNDLLREVLEAFDNQNRRGSRVNQSVFFDILRDKLPDGDA